MMQVTTILIYLQQSIESEKGEHALAFVLESRERKGGVGEAAPQEIGRGRTEPRFCVQLPGVPGPLYNPFRQFNRPSLPCLGSEKIHGDLSALWSAEIRAT